MNFLFDSMDNQIKRVQTWQKSVVSTIGFFMSSWSILWMWIITLHPPPPPHSQRLRCGSPSSPPPTTIITLSKAAVLAVFGWAGGDNLNLCFWGRVCFMCWWSTSSHPSVDHLLMQNRLLLTSTVVNPNFCKVSIFTGKLEHSLLFYWCLLFYWTYCTFLQCCYIIDKQVSDLVI